MNKEKVSSYSQFLDEFEKAISKNIDNIIEYEELEDIKYKNIFEMYSRDNKRKLDEIMNIFFNFDIDYSLVDSLINSGGMSSDKVSADLNKIIFQRTTKAREVQMNYNKKYYYSSPFIGILGYIGAFAQNNYFTFKNGKIKVRDLMVTSDDCISTAIKLSGAKPNYDAIMDREGNIYLAGTFHDELMFYLLSNSIDLREGVRIADSDYLDEISFEPTFDLSSLHKYFEFYANEEDVEKDKYVYLSKSRLRKICEFMKTAKPHLTKAEMCNIFKNADSFGYDFTSTSKFNETETNYHLAMENLRNVMGVLDEMFPDEPSINLVEMCQNRFKEKNFGIV